MSDDDNAVELSRPPAGKLASATRKKHEIEELLSNIPRNLPEIKAQYNEY